MEQKERSFIDKWITPTTLMSIFGAIVWGIQLNIAVINLTKDTAAIKTELVAAMKENNSQNISIAKTATILESLERRITYIETGGGSR